MKHLPWLLALWLFLGLAPHRGEAASRTVILVRHAEKAADDPRDPTLSEAGMTRAETLARLLGKCGATRLAASEFRRTQATLAPLATRLGLPLETIPAGKPAELVAAIRASEEKAVWVVAGHSNTVPALARELGVVLSECQESPQGPVLGDGEYDRLFVLTLPPAEAGVAPTVVELRY